MNKKGVQTIAVHGGEAPDPQTGASAPNIVMSSTFVVEEPVSFSVTNVDESSPFIYTRWSNPTVRQLETKLALLENAGQCIAFASGMAASAGVLLSLLKSGEHLVISNTNYPGTAEIARDLLPAHGIETSPVDTSDPHNIAGAVRDNTRMIWVETPSNPLLRITDIKRAAAIAHQNNAILVVDSTFASPIATRPLDLGADLVVHSLTKYISGHGDTLGGAVLGSGALIAKMRASGVTHCGGVLSPFNAWLTMRGAATLPLRMREHQKNALEIAEFLHRHPRVDLMLYPGHASHPQYDLAREQMSNFSGMIAFRARRPQAIARKMMKELRIIHYAVSLGHHRSLIFLLDTADLIESSFRLTGSELEKYRDVAGDGLFRLSVGLEDGQDLIDDLARVL